MISCIFATHLRWQCRRSAATIVAANQSDGDSKALAAAVGVVCTANSDNWPAIFTAARQQNEQIQRSVLVAPASDRQRLCCLTVPVIASCCSSCYDVTSLNSRYVTRSAWLHATQATTQYLLISWYLETFINKKAVLCGIIQYSIRPKRSAIHAQAVYFLRSTMPSVRCRMSA